MPDLPTPADWLLSLGLASGLGLLVGLQREWVNDPIAGIRTFALVGLLGGLTGILATLFGGWVVAAGLAACAALVVAGNFLAHRNPGADPGVTTEVAVLVVFATGAVAVQGYHWLAVAAAGTSMVLLQGKAALHAMVRKIGENELRALVRLALVGLVILPLLPDREMGYLGVINPFRAWLMVVLIVGISLAAYLAAKFLGGARGTVAAGLLGGLISSTATTVGISRRSASSRGAGPSLAAIALTASSVVFVRVIAEVCLAAPGHAGEILPPLVAMMGWTALVAAASLRAAARDGYPPGAEGPPSDLKGAVLFGLLYLAVLHAVALAKHEFGNAGLYVVAAVSGLTDMDAITLSTARLTAAGHADAGTAWRVILTGGLANLVFKAGWVAALGTGTYRRRTLFGLAAAVGGGGLILAFWR
jgi:uncharacterized membrane protein (DUF4010 family)